MTDERRLVYLDGAITADSVKPSRIAEVIADLEDGILVQELDPETLDPVGEEIEIEDARDIIDKHGQPATKRTWRIE